MQPVSAGWIAEQGEFVGGETCSSTEWGWLICTSTQYDSDVNLFGMREDDFHRSPYAWNTSGLPGGGGEDV